MTEILFQSKSRKSFLFFVRSSGPDLSQDAGQREYLAQDLAHMFSEELEQKLKDVLERIIVM